MHAHVEFLTFPNFSDMQVLCNEPGVCMCMCVMRESSLPTADDSLAGQCQVKEGLAELEGQCVFQCLTINDQRELIFLLQRVAQGRTVSRQCGTSSLQGGKKHREKALCFS